jgi:hypothetical protein
MQQFLDEREKGKSIDDMKLVYKLPQVKKVTAHQVLVNNILEVAGNHPTFNYKYWLGRVSRSKLSMNAILDLVATAKKMDSKYSKGGFLSKRL